VDYFVPEPGFIVEFDESQHFTAARKTALQHYPAELEIGFDRAGWIHLCERLNRHDPAPPYRDEQRAWYDTLRDFLPNIFNLQPTVRLYASDRRWCAMNPDNLHDREAFRAILSNTRPDQSIELRSDPNPRLGRIVICNAWRGELEDARQVLLDACEQWASPEKLDCLTTPGAFLTFPWPSQMPEIGNPRQPRSEAVEALISRAEVQCKRLLSKELIKDHRYRLH